MNPQLQSSEIKNRAQYAGINTAFVEMQERALRVTEALYRTTDLFSDNEPLKWSLRESAVKILQTVSALDQNASFEDFREVHRVEKNIRGLLVKIGLAASGSFMARKNFDVLEREYVALRDLVTNSEQTPALAFSPSQQIIAEQSSLPHDALQMSKEPTKTPMSERIQPMSERKGSILRFIHEKGSKEPINIKDVARSLNAEIGEKTVQRDLNALVKSGLLKKEGEKRWRRYFV